MSRRLTVSALFVLGLFAVVGFTQPPSDAVPKPPAEKKADVKKAVDPLDGLIGAALANDADIKLARAKLQLAEAEVSRARQLVAQKVVALDSAIREQKKAVATAEQTFLIAEAQFKQKSTSFNELLIARETIELAQSKLVQMETEMKLLTGKGIRVAAADGWDDLTAVHRNATWDASCVACHQVPLGKQPGVKFNPELSNSQFFMEALNAARGRHLKTPAGPISDRIRIALDKPVKLGVKDAKVTFEQALDVFKKEAGLDVPVRVDAKITAIVSLGEELPVGAWLQLFADGTPTSRFLVREYGLLVTNTSLNPPDAISVFDFWKQKPEKKVEKAP